MSRHSEVWRKWTLFCRRHFEVVFHSHYKDTTWPMWHCTRQRWSESHCLTLPSAAMPIECPLKHGQHSNPGLGSIHFFLFNSIPIRVGFRIFQFDSDTNKVPMLGTHNGACGYACLMSWDWLSHCKFHNMSDKKRLNLIKLDESTETPTS